MITGLIEFPTFRELEVQVLGSRLFKGIGRLLSVAPTGADLQAFFVTRQQGLSATFGPLVKKHRLAKKLSQEALAEIADVHPTYVGLLERRQRTPGIDVAERIAKALGLKLSQMIAEAERATKGSGRG
jgi:ribosome-binding protein aMBF1 (putative translation factor)